MLSLGILAVGLFPFATAAPVPTVPGAQIVLSPCTVDADAACWRTAGTARRFAADPRVSERIEEASVRLARDGDRLLIRVDELPAGAKVEVLVHPVGRTEITKIDAYDSVGVGLHSVQARLGTGELREVRLGLRLADGERLVWAPHGSGWTEDTALAVVSAHPPRERAQPSLTRDGGVLTVDATGASQVRLRALDPSVLHPREALLKPPFSFIGPPPLQLPEPPDRGRYAVEAIWTADGVPTQIAQRRVKLPGVLPLATTQLGILPAPDQLERGSGAALEPRRLKRICIDQDSWRPQAELLASELSRLTALDLPVALCGPGRRRIHIGSRAGPTEAFSVEVGSDRVHIEAGSRRAATWAGHALVDLMVEHDTRPPALRIEDEPDLSDRVLVHRIDGKHTADRNLDEHAQFLRRVVSRGRYNAVVLVLRGGLQYDSHPELAQRGALSKQELRTLLQVLEDLDIEAIPGLNSPGHADWLLGAHPHLREDQNGRLVCTRHPETWPLLRDLIDELIQAFEAERIHIGADETWWGSARHPPHERCPRCASTPRPELFAAHLARQIDHIQKKGVRPMIWSDMITPRWNGSTEEVHRARELVSLDEVDVLAWSDIGEGARVLGREGLSVLQVATGLHPARIAPLADGTPLAGAGLALFVPRPWQIGGWGVTRHRALWSHTPNVILAGLLAWRRDLSTSDPDVILVSLADHPALQPGARVVERASRWLTPTGASDASVPPTPLLSRSIRPEASRPDAIIGGSGEAIVLPVSGSASRLGLLHAIDLDRDAEIRLESQFSRADTRSGAPVAAVRIVYEDGSDRAVPLFLGRTSWSSELEPGALGLWESQEIATFRPTDSPFDVLDQQRSLFLVDLAQDQRVREVRIEPVPGARVRLAGALIWD